MVKVMKQLMCFVLILGLTFGGLVGLVPKPSYALSSHPIISEILDGGKGVDGKYDRFIEIYNPTQEAIDLTGYKVIKVSNGKDSETFELTGSLESGKALVITQKGRNIAGSIESVSDHWSSFNGGNNDGAKLLNGTDIIDLAVGKSFKDSKMVRNYDVESPNATFTDSEWTVTKCDNLLGATPGNHDSQYPESTTKVAKVVATPDSGKTFDFNQGNGTVTLTTTTENAEIYYGVVNHPNETTGPSAFVKYSSPINLVQAADIYAYATKDGMENSDTIKASYYGLDIANIADVRNENGRLVKVVGIATGRVGSNAIYIQDKTAGIILSEYKSGPITLNIGDKVEVVGTIAQFYDNAQIQPAKTSDVKVIQANAGVPDAKVVTASQFSKLQGESIEGQLVTIKNVNLAAKDSKGNVLLTDKTGSVKMLYSGKFYEEENHESITGVVNYHYGEYKILPRSKEDFVQDSSKADRPSASMPSGNIEDGAKITLSTSTNDGKIYYAIGADKASVTLNYGEGTLYQEPITINEANKYLKAYTKADGLDNSVMVEYSYTLAEVTHIHDIQGASHVSPLNGQDVAGVKGIVTAVSKDKYQKGFFMQEQDALTDGDIKTSEGIFVATDKTFNVGDLVSVTGRVQEKKNDSWDGTLKETQLKASAVEKLGSDYDLPTPIILGKNGRPVITDIVDNDSFKVFDPQQDAIDYYEAVEGMLIKVEKPAIVGGDERYGEIYILADNGEASSSKRSYRGGIILTENNMNPEIMTVDDVIIPITASKRFKDASFTPNPGDKFNGDVTGVMGYGFGKYKIYNNVALPSVVDMDIASQKPITNVIGDDETVTVASFNVENFSKDKGEEKADAIANAIVTNMKTPDIIALIEVQDNDGDTKSDVVDGSESYQFLIDRVKLASKTAGKEVVYSFTEIAPVKDTDGGIPGGNIRVGYLYNAERVSLADGEPGGSTEAVSVLDNGHLSKNPGRIDPMNEAFNSTRKSLVAEFVFKDESVYVVTNHLSSKRGDAPTFGDTQPVVRKSEVNRHKQAQIINDFVDSLKTKNPDANVVVLGDMNDFHFSETLKVIAGKGDEKVLINPISLLPLGKQFTYNYGGSSQVLDNILVSDNINYTCEALSINAGFYHSQGRASDHDPVMLGINFGEVKPVISISEARAKEKGEEVTVKAVVQNNQGAIGGQAFTISDDTAAIYVYTKTDSSLVEGDRVIVTGNIDEFYGLKQIKNPNIKVIGKGYDFDIEVVTSIGEEDESKAVHFTKATVESISTDKKGKTFITLTSGNENIKAVLDKVHSNDFESIKSMVATGSQVSVTGIVKEEYSEYRLYLRGINDIGPYVSPALTLSEVRNKTVGTEVVTEGVVLNIPGAFGNKSFAFADDHAGMFIYTNKDLPEGLTYGTKIRVTGKTAEHEGLMQIDYSNIEILSQKNSTSYYHISNKSELNNYESEGVLLKNVVVKSLKDGKYHNGELTVTINGEDVFCKLDNRSGYNYESLAEKVSVGDEINVFGVVTSYKGNFSIRLRDANDVRLVKSVKFNDAKITGMDGKEKTDITKNDMIFVEPSIKYSEESPIRGLLMVKIVNKKNEMVRVGMVRNQLIMKSNATYASLGFDLSGLPKGEYKIKMFLWNNWDDKESLANPFEKVFTIK